VGPRRPPAPGPLGRQQTGSAHEAQHPLAAGVDALLPAQPGLDFAIALAENGEFSSTRRMARSSCSSPMSVRGLVDIAHCL